MHISRPICANDLGTCLPSPYIECFKVYLNHWREVGGRCALALLCCVSVTDDMGIGEQNKSMATGLIYVQTDFGAI